MKQEDKFLIPLTYFLSVNSFFSPHDDRLNYSEPETKDIFILWSFKYVLNVFIQSVCVRNGM